MLYYAVLVRRAEHSLEMLCWIRLQIEISAFLIRLFYFKGGNGDSSIGFADDLGIGWHRFSIVVAEIMVLLVMVVLLRVNRKKYGY